MLTPAESKELYPLLDANNFYASLFRSLFARELNDRHITQPIIFLSSLYSPQDGNIDPNGFCTALARGATNAGAKG